MTNTITLQRYVVEKALDALKIGHESAHDCAETFHIEMAGYKQQRHEALDAEVKQTSDAIGALRAALEKPDAGIPASVPAGWKLVPVEPTRAMLDAYARLQGRFNSARSDWAAMLAAAPQPQVVEQPQVEQETVAWAEEIIEYLHAHYDTEMIKELDSGDALIRLDDAIAAVEEVEQRYTHPQPPRQPLTDAQINDHRLALSYDGEDLPDPWDFKQGVRAAERAHGIGGEK